MNPPNEIPKDRGRLRLATTCLFLLLVAGTVNAQQINGMPGSPSATTTINGKYLPPPTRAVRRSDQPDAHDAVSGCGRPSWLC